MKVGVFIKNKKTNYNEVANAFALVSQLGFMMVVTFLIHFFLGRFLDDTFNTSPIFLIIFILIGIYNSIRNMYIFVSKTWKD